MDGVYLMSECGVPYEAVFGPVRGPMSPTRRHAFIIARGELKGGEWDWNAGKWLPRKGN